MEAEEQIARRSFTINGFEVMEYQENPTVIRLKYLVPQEITPPRSLIEDFKYFASKGVDKLKNLPRRLRFPLRVT